jgi:hypothetical protein
VRPETDHDIVDDAPFVAELGYQQELHRGLSVNTFSYAPVAVSVVLASATILWFASGCQPFMKGVPAGHVTKRAEEILG